MNTFNRFGISIPDTLDGGGALSFKLGKVERVFNDDNDWNKYNKKKSIDANHVHNASQMIVFYDLTNKDTKKPVEKFAQPFFRGITDSITHNDLILWTTINKLKFYLGPVNTYNDPMYSASHVELNTQIGKQIKKDNRADNKNGYNANVITMPVNKVGKVTNKNIDDPFDKFKGEGGLADYQSRMSDLVLEGRYNNHIRIGNRSLAPIISINNGVGASESTDGSLMLMTSLGSIDDHLITLDPDAESDGKNYINYQPSCDTEINNSGIDYIRGWNLGFGNDKKGIVNREQNKFDNKYGPSFVILTDEEKEDFKTNPDADRTHQIFITSERILFDARNDDFIVSSKRNINFGAGGNVTITNSGFSVIQSKNIYLGKEAKKRTEPMVLGNELNEVLKEIAIIIKDAHALVQGVPIPLVDELGAKLSLRIDSLLGNLENTYTENVNNEDDLNPIPIGDRSTGGPSFYSQHHFIETNRKKTTQE
jgi:hypothetical protein